MAEKKPLLLFQLHSSGLELALQKLPRYLPRFFIATENWAGAILGTLHDGIIPSTVILAILISSGVNAPPQYVSPAP